VCAPPAARGVGYTKLWNKLEEAVAQQQNVLVVFPHPDDAAFFAAGTLARWAAEGCAVTAVCCTSGNLGTLDPHQTMEAVAEARERELRAANALLGVRETVMLGHPDGGFIDAVRLRMDLVGLVRKFRPDRLLTLDPWLRYEVHPDHEVVGRMAAEAAAFGAFPLLHPEQLSGGVRPHSPGEVWFMGVLGRAPNCYVDISATIGRKVESALRFQATLAILARMLAPEIDPADVSAGEAEALPGHADRWLRSMAAQVGAAVGLAAAEAFYVQKCLPGHFDNMREAVGEMLSLPPGAPTVL
jgi:LmbE family N-acetylglucosaminyl deacetylase